MDKSTLLLEYDFGFGLDGIDSDPSNPIQIALSDLVGKGAPIKDHTFCFLTTDATPRWFGVFILSEGDRIIFIPGVDQRLSWFQTTYRKTSTSQTPFGLEHFTFEPRRKRWHFTDRGRKKHQGGRKARITDDDLLLWCGYSLSAATVLREVKQITQVSYEVPDSDLERRMSQLTRLENTGANCLISLTESGSDKSFPHFLFVVSWPDSPIYGGSEYLQPLGSPNFTPKTTLGDSQQELFRHRIALGGKYAIQIFSMRVPGELTLPVVMTSHGN